MLVHFNHVASGIVNTNHGIVRAAAMLCVADCVADRVRSVIPQPTEWQSIGNQIDAPLQFAICKRFLALVRKGVFENLDCYGLGPKRDRSSDAQQKCILPRGL
jgi:hypothetical protein